MECSSQTRPHFSWPIYLRGIFLLIVDALLVGGICYAVLKFILYQVFGGSPLNIDLFKGKNWVDIVRYSIWPLNTFMLVLLFRNPLLQILYEIPGFIRRSYYRIGGNEISQGDEDSSISKGTEAKAAKHVKGDENEKGDNADHSKLKAFEECVITAMRDEFPTMRCLTNMAIIEGSKYSFDIAFEAQDRLFCVEIKYNPKSFCWRKIVNRVNYIYERLSDCGKRYFTFVVCVGSEPDESIHRLLGTKPYYWEIRWYREDGTLHKIIRGGGIQ